MAVPQKPIDPNARFERQRTLAKQESNAQAQEAKGAMQRRFAAMGRLNSGAAVKNEQQINQQSNEALQKRLQAVQDAEDTEGLRRQEIDEARKFQSSEREASQSFASREAGLGREFSRGERLGSQDFAAMQADLQRKYGTSEREASQVFAKGQQEAGFKFANWQGQIARSHDASQNDANRAIQREAMTEQTRQFNKQFGLQFDQYKLDKLISEFNMNKANAGSNDWFSRIGDTGTGLFKGLENWGFSTANSIEGRSGDSKYRRS